MANQTLLHRAKINLANNKRKLRRIASEAAAQQKIVDAQQEIVSALEAKEAK